MGVRENITGVLVWCPCFRSQMYAETSTALYALGQFFQACNIPNSLAITAVCDITDGRNAMVTRFFDTHIGFSHMLMVDNDMFFPWQLVHDMLLFDKPVTGVVYSKRELPPSIIGCTLPENETVVKDGFMNMKYTGTGIFLIKRHVISDMLKAMPELNKTNDIGDMKKLGITRMLKLFDRMHDVDGNYLSEDYSFCERWRRCGGEVWANIAHPIVHIGNFDYAMRYADVLASEAARKQAEQRDRDKDHFRQVVREVA